MLGYIKDEELMQQYLKCNLVMVTAEYGEGFGLPIIEGYLFNKPVIASNKCAIPEVIISKKYLFENNSNNLILKLNEIRNNYIEYNFRKYYDKKFSNNVILAKYKNIYLNLQK